MKLRVEHDALADAVAWVARALPARPVVPVLSGLRLEAGERLALSCFDYELSAAVGVEADVAEPGAVLVPGRLLAEIVRSLPGQPVELSSDNDTVNLTCGSAEFALVSLPLSEFPALPPVPPVAGTVDGGDLAAAIGQVLPAVSRDDTLPILTAVYLDIHGEVMTLAATDRYRMAVRDVSWEPARAGLRAVALVPARTLADAARTLTAGVPVTVSFAAGRGGPSGEADDAPHGQEGTGGGHPRPAEGMISFESGGRRLTGRLMSGEAIRYESRFPTGFGCRAEVPAQSFTEAVRRVSLVADRASPVQLTFTPGRVIIEAQTEGRARAVETVTASFSGDQPSIAFNPHYLLDGLTAAAGGVARPARPREETAPAPAVAAEGGEHDGHVDGMATGRKAPGEGTPGPGYIRLEFTSPAKPALITWRGGVEEAPGEPAGQRAPAGPAGRPAFRYLVVPLRPPARA